MVGVEVGVVVEVVVGVVVGVGVVVEVEVEVEVEVGVIVTTNHRFVPTNYGSESAHAHETPWGTLSHEHDAGWESHEHVLAEGEALGVTVPTSAP